MIELVSGEKETFFVVRQASGIVIRASVAVGVPVLQAQAMVDSALPVPPAGVCKFLYLCPCLYA